jgi:hypothetical protein
MFYVFILPIKLLATVCTGELFIIVVDCIFVPLKIVFPWECLKTYIALELHGQNDSNCSIIGFLELPLDMHILRPYDLDIQMRSIHWGVKKMDKQNILRYN